MDRIVVLALVLLVAASGTSFAAAPVITPVIPSGINTGFYTVCLALNASKKTANVTVEFVNADTGVPTTTYGPTPVAPGAMLNAFTTYSVSSYCRVTGLSAKKVHVTFFVQRTVNDILMTVTAP